ncbi:MAG: hypothetical protein E7185_09895 [Erysipelotrichaceae bacterium]|nr:hypothetical protein [Erysipelotrichaceae bacterium]
MNNRKIMEEQLRRTEYYPDDRIPFYGSTSAATEDQRNIDRYLNKDINLYTLCQLVERTNCLPEGYVTPEKMLSELKYIGRMK